MLREQGETGEVKSRFVHDWMAVLLEKVSSGDETNYNSYYGQDEQRNILYLTNEAGEVKNTYDYGVFVEEIKTEKIENPLCYTGQQYDRKIGQCYIRLRCYNPTIGRLTQENEYKGDGLNLYAGSVISFVPQRIVGSDLVRNRYENSYQRGAYYYGHSKGVVKTNYFGSVISFVSQQIVGSDLVRIRYENSYQRGAYYYGHRKVKNKTNI